MHKNNIIFSILVYWITLTTNLEVNGQQSSVRKPQKGCSGYGYQIWLSCLTNPCLFATCPRFHGIATCKKEISSDCKTCRAAFFIHDRRVNCQPTNFECPPGLPLQDCVNDPCTITECRDDRFKGAECRGYYCGACLAEYFVDGTWQQCPNPDVKLQGDAALLLPEIRRAMNEFPGDSGRSQSSGVLTNTCPDGTPEPECSSDVCARTECPQYSRATCVVNKCQGCKPEFYLRGQLVNCQSTKCRRNVLEMKCSDDPCKYATCPLYPAAECKPSNCGYCHPEWFVNNKIVNCFSRMPDNYQCPNGLQQQQCPRNTCRFKRCLKNAQTFCRINNCGGCYAEYVNTKGEMVDCVGWWTKYESKKPKELLEVSVASVMPTSGSTSTGTSQIGQNPGPGESLGSNQAASSTQTQSQKSKELILDTLFGELGLDGPANTNIVSNTADSKPSRNPWETLVNDQGETKPKDTKTVVIKANNSPADQRVDLNKPVQLVIQRQPIKNVQIKSSGTKPTWSDPRPDVPERGQQVSVNNRPVGIKSPLDQVKSFRNKPKSNPSPSDQVKSFRNKPKSNPSPSDQVKSINNRPVGNQSPWGKVKSINIRQIVNQPPSDPFKPISISLDSMNNNKNFVPGVPIHGFPWRQNLF